MRKNLTVARELRGQVIKLGRFLSSAPIVPVAAIDVNDTHALTAAIGQGLLV